MALRSGTGASDYSRRINTAVKHLTSRAGLSNNELIKRAGMSLNYFYTRMRGEATFDTNDLDVIARVLGVDVATIVQVADQIGDDGLVPGSPVVTDSVAVNGIELARRLRLLLGGEPKEPQDVASVSAARMSEMLTAGQVFTASLGELEDLAAHFSVPASYLVETTASEDAEMVEAQLELSRAFADAGAEPVAARALGGLSASAIRAVAASIRSIKN